MANDKMTKESNNKEANDKKSEEVIDSFCAKQEESYDQFMKSFTMLKKEDVIEQLMKDVGDELTMKPIEEEVTKSTLMTFKDKKLLEVSEDVETEILLEGNCVGSMSSNEIPVGKKSVQFDNFVEEVESDEDDGTVGGKYEASFGYKSKETEKMDETCSEQTIDSNTLANRTDIKPIPGEAEVDIDTTRLHPVINTTQLDLSSRLQQLDQATDSQSEVTSDEVVPFSLDEKFDYDNVILTPKWTGSDRPPGFANDT